MGCGLSRDSKRIQKTTAIEIISEAEYNPSMKNVTTVILRSRGLTLTLHYRNLC